MSDHIIGGIERKAALARTTRDWMDIYIQVVENVLKDTEATEEARRQLHERFLVSRSRLRKIGKAFHKAGLTLDERMEIEGVAPPSGPGQQPVWDTPRRPRVAFIWPDGSQISFINEEALSAFGFFLWWSNFQSRLVADTATPKRRIIQPGDPEHRSYMHHKRRDQDRGIEPR